MKNNIMLLEKVAQVIRTKRESLKLSQRELSRRARVSQSAISYVESASANLRLGTLERIARALKLTLVWRLA